MDNQWKFNRQCYSTLFKLNKVLDSRIKSKRIFYSGFVIVVCAALFSLLSGMLLGGFTNSLPLPALKGLFVSVAFWLFYFDLLITLLKFQSNTLVEYRHLSVLPISQAAKFAFDFLANIADLKSLIYLSVFLPLVIFLLLKVSILAALLSIPCFAFFVIANQSLLIFAVRVTTWLPPGLRRNSSVVGILVFWFYLAAVLTGKYVWLQAVPTVSFFGSSLFEIVVRNFTSVMMELGFLLVTFTAVTYVSVKIRWKV